MSEPSGVNLNGTKYRLIGNGLGVRPFRKMYSPAVIRQPEIAGQRPLPNPLPEVLVYRMSDWSRGEGYKHVTSDPDDPAAGGYYYSTDAVDVTVPGELSLGLALTQDFTSAVFSSTGGPFVTGVSSAPWLVVSDTVYERTGEATWTSRATLTGNTVGPPSAMGGSIFAGNGTNIERILASSPYTVTTWGSSAGRSMRAADSRLYYLRTETERVVLCRIALQPAASAPFTRDEVYPVAGVGVGLMPVALGSTIIFATQSSGEDPRVHIFEAEAGREIARLDGASMNIDPQHSLVSHKGLAFLAGVKDDRGGGNKPVLYFTNGETLGSIMFRPNEELASPGSAIACGVGRENEIIVGTNDSTLFRYDMRTGGYSQFLQDCPLTAITSVIYHGGRYLVGCTDGAANSRVYITKTSGSGKYVSAATVVEPISDFDYPEVTKVITEVEVHTSSLDDGCSVEVQLILDDTTTITTDSAGATMAHTSGSRSVFTVSDHDTEQRCFYVEPRVVVKTSNTANTPTVYTVIVRARPVATVVGYEMYIDCSDMTAGDRLPGRQATGDKQKGEIETLIENSGDRVWSMVPLYTSTRSPHPGPTGSTVSVMLDEAEYVSLDRGEGAYRIKVWQL